MPVDIPTRLRELRHAAGISQRTAARHAGVSPGTWTRWEAGTRKPRLQRLTALANALDTPVCGLDPPHGLTAIADIYLTADTLNRVRQGGQPAADQVAASLAAALSPTILQRAKKTTAPIKDTPTPRQPGRRFRSAVEQGVRREQAAVREAVELRRQAALVAQPDNSSL